MRSARPRRQTGTPDAAQHDGGRADVRGDSPGVMRVRPPSDFVFRADDAADPAVYWRIAAALVAAVFVAVTAARMRAIVRPRDNPGRSGEILAASSAPPPALGALETNARSIPECDGGTVGPAIQTIVRQQNEYQGAGGHERRGRGHDLRGRF